MIERHIHPTPDELLHKDVFTPEEAAEALMLGVNTLRHAVFTGELPAQIVGHDVVAIDRQEILDWFMANEGKQPMA
jgi:hypothetical protein